jgi:hypothetical protein
MRSILFLQLIWYKNMTLTRQESIHTAAYKLKTSSEFASCGIYNLNGPTPLHKTIVDIVLKYNLNNTPNLYAVSLYEDLTGTRSFYFFNFT